MRVMWVVGRMPGEIARGRGFAAPTGGGWQDALLESVAKQPGLQLLVAYPGPIRGATERVGSVDFVSLGPSEPLHRVARVLSRWAPDGYFLGKVRECLRVMDDWAPDVVHVHGTESGLGLIAERSTIPVMVSIQGLLCVYADVARAQRRLGLRGLSLWEVVRGTSRWHRSRSMRRDVAAERRMLAACRFVAGRTEFDRRVCAVLAPSARYLGAGELLRRPFYESKRWEPPGRVGRVPVVCLMGGSFWRKGADTAIAAAAALRSNGVSVEVHLLGIRTGSEDASLALREARRCGLPSGAVVICGELDAKGIIRLLLEADVFVLPSRADNSPNSLCEAMLLGVPCIVSTAGGIPSLATDRQDALLVPPGDVLSLAGALGELIADNELALRLSRAARARAAERHDRAQVTEGLLAAYRTVIGTSAEEPMAALAAAHPATTLDGD